LLLGPRSNTWRAAPSGRGNRRRRREREDSEARRRMMGGLAWSAVGGGRAEAGV